MNALPSPVSSQRRRSLLFPASVSALLAVSASAGLAATLKGWWKFDGNYNDSTATGLNGTAIGEPAFDADVPSGMTGQSMLLDNNAEGVQIEANDALNAQQFTLGYFINYKELSDSTGLERLTGRQNYTFETAVGDAHVIGGTTSTTGQTFSYYSPSTAWVRTHVDLPLETWVHVAWRNSDTEMQLFVNGESVFTGPPVTTPITGFMNFGTTFQNPAEGMGGLIDDAFYADGLLTPDEIKSIAENGVASFGGDTDGDGLPNSWETKYGLNPNDGTGVNGAAGNGDNDGLTNTQEYVLGTDPTKADTDGDGLKDGDEVTRTTNPLVADTDGDGLNDGDEVTRTTDPLVADTDGDGFSDGDEVAGGSNPLLAASFPPPSALLVLRLNFEADTQDSSPKANHGTLLDLPEFVDDSSPGGGQALSFTTNPMGVSVPGNASLSSSVFTLSYWVKPTSLQEGAGVERLTSRGGDLFETAIGNRAGVGGGADLTLSYFQGTWLSSGVSLVLDEWAHVAWRNAGAGAEDMTLWVNGEKVYTGQGVPANRPGSGLMNIGTRHNGVEGFEGRMDDVRLYRAALLDTDMPALAVPAVGSEFRFEITSAVRAADGSSLTLTFRSRANRTYAVDYCTDVAAGPWIELTDSLPSGGAQTQYTDIVGSKKERACYRVRDITP